MLLLHLDYPGVRIRYETGNPPRLSPDRSTDAFDSTGINCRAFHCRHFSLVPDDLFDPGFQQDYLLQLGMPPEVRAGVWVLPEWQSRLVCSLERSDEPVTTLELPIWRVLLHHAHTLTAHQPQPFLWGHFSEGCLFLTAVASGALQFFNQFEVREPSDVLYFLLQSLDQWGQPPATCQVWLSGTFTTDSPLYQLLEQYLGGLATVPALGPELPGLEGAAPHLYPDLRSFAQCVSSAAG